MTEEELDEALDIRDEYIHAFNQCKNELWWDDLVNESQNGNLKNFMKLWVENEVDESDAYNIWMYHRGPFREEKNGKAKMEPMEDIKNFSFMKFMSFI